METLCINLYKKCLNFSSLGINGHIYGNIEGLVMDQNDRVNWYLIAFGTEIDVHTIHFHAHTFLHRTFTGSHRGDTLDIFGGIFETVEMVTAHPGTWLLHCHVGDHLAAGMETVYTVRNASKYLLIISKEEAIYTCIYLYIYNKLIC